MTAQSAVTTGAGGDACRDHRSKPRSLDLQLTEEERAVIGALPKDHSVVNPDSAPDWDQP